MTEKYFVLLIFLAYGLVAFFRPEWIAKMQIWTNKKIFGAKFEPSQRTLKFYQAMGVLFLIMTFFIFIAD
jgi:hypothetical protein